MTVKVHLEGDGLLFNDETTAFNAAQIIGFLKNHEALGGTTTSASASGQSMLGAAKPRLSPREALLNAGAKTNPQKIVTLGKYIIQMNGSESFSLDEVKIAFRKAGESLPKNFSRDVKDAVTANLIYEDDPEHYVLTEQAEEYLTNGFPEPLAQKKIRKQVTGHRTSSRATMNEELFTRLRQGHGAALKQYIEERRAAYDAKASNQIAIISTWLLDEEGLDSVALNDLQAVRRFLGEPGGNLESQMKNAMARESYFSHRKEGRFFLSSKGEDYGRLKSRA